MNGISVTQETISPEVAAKYLAINTHNRNLVEARVVRIARDIAEGNWALNGESIKFSKTDKLLDGQHRLKAIVLADKPIQTIVIRGLDESAQETIDTGAKRTFGDVLRLNGEAYVNTLAAAARVSYNLTTYGEPTTNPTKYPTGSELLRYFNAHEELRDSSSFGSQAAHSSLRIPSGMACALHYHMSQLDAVRTEEFWRQLLENDAPAGSAIHALRESLTKDLGRPHRMDTQHRMALIIKAWNAWLAGRTMTYVLYRASGAGAEGFPRLAAPEKNG